MLLKEVALNLLKEDLFKTIAPVESEPKQSQEQLGSKGEIELSETQRVDLTPNIVDAIP